MATGLAVSTPRFTSQAQKLDRVDWRTRMVLEDHELLEYPLVGLDASFCFPTLLTLKVAEVLDQLRELLGHGLSPPARTTTTFSLVSSGRDDPAVKRTHGARGQRRREAWINARGFSLELGHVRSLLYSRCGTLAAIIAPRVATTNGTA